MILTSTLNLRKAELTDNSDFIVFINENMDILETAIDGKSDTGHNHTGVYEPADATILKDADIGVTVQSYNLNTVIDSAYVHTDNNYTTTEKNKLLGIESNATADQTKADIDALGIDADTVDSLHASQFLRSDVSDVATGQITVNQGVKTGNFEIVHNSTTDSLNFNYVG